MKSFAAIFTNRGVVICSLVVAGWILYGRTLPYPFAFDCWSYLYNNHLITDLKYFRLLTDINALALADRQLGLPNDVAINFLARPLLYLTFCANYLLHGLNPAGFRVVNIALHIFNALLVFLFLERLLDFSTKTHKFDSFSVRFIPVFTAMLFLLHPLQIESVTYIMQRSNPLVTCFCLGTLLLYHRFVSEHHYGKRWLFRWGSVAALLCGMFVEESMVTVPLLLLLLEIIWLGNALKPALLRLLPHLCLLPVVPLLVLAVGELQRARGSESAGIMNILNYSDYSPWQYGVTQLCVIAGYLRLLLLPFGQNVDPDFPLYSSLLQWRPLGALTLLLLFILIPLLLFRRRADDSSSLLLFATGWFFLGLAASSGIVPQPDLMVENRVYSSSIGFFIVLAVLICWLREVRVLKRWVVPAAVVMVVTYGAVAWARNSVWSSNISLWEDAVAKSPAKVRVWHNLGMSYLDEARNAEAIECFTMSLSLNPSYQLSYDALVKAYTREGRFAEAQSVAFAGLSIAPDNAVLHNNLGVIYAETGQVELARHYFEKALLLRPNYGSARMNLDQLMAGQVRK